jgi:predicted double-glycine peptidase
MTQVGSGCHCSRNQHNLLSWRKTPENMSKASRKASLVALALALTMGISFLLSDPVCSGADIRFGGIVPGGTIYKKVESMREARYRDLITQHTDFSCGAAALATILKYAYDRNDINEDVVLAGLFQVSEPSEVMRKGFSLLDIKNYVETLDMRGRGYRVTAKDLEKVKIPTIVLLDIKGYKHFVVFKKATQEKVYVADPALGNKIMDMDDFLAGWNGVLFAVIGKGFDLDSVLLRPREALTARNLGSVHASIKRVDLLEFGFTRTELF